MKHFKLFLLSLLLTSIAAKAQLVYFWQDSIAISAAEIDTTFDRRYIGATIYPSGCDIDIKIAINNADTTFDNKEYLRILDGVSLDLWPEYLFYEAGLYRLNVKTVDQGTGFLYIFGVKSGVQ